MPKVAIITGGASGIGLYIATELAQQPKDWSIHILDLNAPQGESAALAIGATFHQCDVTDYDSLAAVFKNIYQQHKRLDFVHANAGIVERFNFITGHPDTDEDPPPPPDMSVIDINLKGVIKTNWLALHYMKLTKKTLGDENWEGNLVMTSSIAGLYAGYVIPQYSAAKYGVIGLTRSLAPLCHRDHRIRVNCICPGLVRTGMTDKMQVPEKYITPREKIVEAVMMLIQGEGRTDSAGVKVETGQMYGRVVEVCQDWFRFREMQEVPESIKVLVQVPPPAAAFPIPGQNDVGTGNTEKL